MCVCVCVLAPGSELSVRVSGNAVEQQLQALKASTKYVVTIVSRLGEQKSSSTHTTFTTTSGEWPLSVVCVCVKVCVTGISAVYLKQFSEMWNVITLPLFPPNRLSWKRGGTSGPDSQTGNCTYCGAVVETTGLSRDELQTDVLYQGWRAQGEARDESPNTEPLLIIIIMSEGLNMLLNKLINQSQTRYLGMLSVKSKDVVTKRTLTVIKIIAKNYRSKLFCTFGAFYTLL